jgi:hypothetical protein
MESRTQDLDPQDWQTLVGTWRLGASHPLLPGDEIRGDATFEWLDGRRLLSPSTPEQSRCRSGRTAPSGVEHRRAARPPHCPFHAHRHPTGRSILWSMTGGMTTRRSVASAQARSVGGVRYTTVVPDDVLELLLTEAALDKLGARAILADEVGQLLRNAHVVVRNPRAASPGSRRLLIRAHEWWAVRHARDRADGRAHDLARRSPAGSPPSSSVSYFLTADDANALDRSRAAAWRFRPRPGDDRPPLRGSASRRSQREGPDLGQHRG